MEAARGKHGVAVATLRVEPASPANSCKWRQRGDSLQPSKTNAAIATLKRRIVGMTFGTAGHMPSCERVFWYVA